jgi:toxin ParE1/3/4
VIRPVVFRPQAEAEVLVIRRWYEDRRQGLGDEFEAALDHLVTRISETPLAFQRVGTDSRRAVLQRFPYAIYFRLLADDIIVLAVHGRQHPARWQARS